jgi:hypothetical protein
MNAYARPTRLCCSATGGIEGRCDPAVEGGFETVGQAISFAGGLDPS